MKIKRYKKVNRTLRFYGLHFGFRRPYQVLVDGTICVTALKNKINLKEQFTKYLDGDVKLLTTLCIVKETEELQLFGACHIVKQFPVHQCGHNVPVSGSHCLLSMVESGNKSRYMVATQDRKLQDGCRGQPGIPLLYLHIITPTLEAPAPPSLEYASEQTRQTCAVRPQDQEALSLLKDAEPSEPMHKRRKRPRAPNPLSCKKKKCLVAQSIVKLKPKRKKRKKTVLEKKIRKEVIQSISSQ